MLGKFHLLLTFVIDSNNFYFFLRMENRPVNQPIKPAVPRTNVNESLPDRKSAKTTTTTTVATTTATTTVTTTTTKSATQKTTNSAKPVVNAPVKPMPNKRSFSPGDDRLSDDECN